MFCLFLVTKQPTTAHHLVTNYRAIGRGKWPELVARLCRNERAATSSVVQKNGGRVHGLAVGRAQGVPTCTADGFRSADRDPVGDGRSHVLFLVSFQNSYSVADMILREPRFVCPSSCLYRE